ASASARTHARFPPATCRTSSRARWRWSTPACARSPPSSATKLATRRRTRGGGPAGSRARWKTRSSNARAACSPTRRGRPRRREPSGQPRLVGAVEAVRARRREPCRRKQAQAPGVLAQGRRTEGADTGRARVRRGAPDELGAQAVALPVIGDGDRDLGGERVVLGAHVADDG